MIRCLDCGAWVESVSGDFKCQPCEDRARAGILVYALLPLLVAAIYSCWRLA